MRQRFTARPGQSLMAISLQTGFMRGVEIDNPSGSWLYVPSVDTYIPPFTMGWATGFPYDVSAIDILAGVAPSGQLSTLQGDPIIVYVTDQLIGASPGAPDVGREFIDKFTPVLAAALSIFCPYTTGTQGTLIPSVTDKRIRILTVTIGVRIRRNNIAPAQDSMSGADFFLGDDIAGAGAALMFQGTLTPHGLPTIPYVFPEGLDIGINGGFDYIAFAHYSDVVLSLSATYQVI